MFLNCDRTKGLYTSAASRLTQTEAIGSTELVIGLKMWQIRGAESLRCHGLQGQRNKLDAQGDMIISGFARNTKR